jgi:hypothetical protein
MPRIVELDPGEVCPLCKNGFRPGAICVLAEKARIESDGSTVVLLKEDAAIYHADCINEAVMFLQACKGK